MNEPDSTALSDLSLRLRTHFGHDRFRPGQEQVMRALLAGRSALAVFPTGGGKSLCYQLPALELPGLTLVVSPLIALMKDQVDALQARGLPAARLDTTLERSEVLEVYRDLADGTLKLLYVAPERLANEGFLKRLREVRLSLLAIDEAHCISEWGHNFRPDYLKLAQFAEDYGVERVLALTATATPEVAADVCRTFEIAGDDHVQTGFHRENLHLHVTPCPKAERPARLLERLREQGEGATVVYVTLQRTAEDVASHLAKAGVSARAYHAGLKTEERAEIQEAFMSGGCQVVVATIAFGMGIDKSDIRAVYHYNLPKTLENYVQEIGRAGRDGQPARCEILACADDVVVLGNFAYGDTPEPETVGRFLEDLFSRGPEFSVSRYTLSQTHDLRELVVGTLLTYLELDGVLRSTGPYYSGYRFQLLCSEDELVATFDPERQSFLRDVLRAAKQGRKWYTVEPAQVSLAIGQPRERILAALEYLAGEGHLELRPSGLRHGYVLENGPSDAGELAALQARLAEAFQSREQRDADRLQRVLEFCALPGCLTKELLRYFGETLEEDCGHCLRCEGEPPAEIPSSPLPELGQAELELVQAVAGEGHESLASPRQLARFLCGLTSPKTSRARLRRHERCGWFAPVPFPQVLELCQRALG